MRPQPGKTAGDGRGNRLVWLTEEPALYESLEDSMRREGFAPEQHGVRRLPSLRLDGETTLLVLEVEDPGHALAVSRRPRRADGPAPPTLVVLHRRNVGLLGATLRRGALDVVVGPEPDPDLILSRLVHLRRSRNEIREVGLLRREMTRRLRQLRMIHRVGQTLAFSLDPEEILQTAVDSLRDVFHYPRTAILLRQSGNLVLRAHAGYPVTASLDDLCLPEGRGVVGAAVAAGETVNVADVETDERYFAIDGVATRSELVVPIRAGGVVRGVVDIQSDDPAAFDAADREAIETLADQIGAGLANARLYAELRGRSEEIEEAYRRLRESDRLKDGFLSSISHELRTPLTSIRSFSEILLGAREEEPETVDEFLEIIHEESLRLTRLVDNLLDISKMNAGMMTWTLLETDPSVVIRRAAQSASSLAQEKDIVVAVDVPGELPCVRMDADRVIQVLINLLANAIKFSDAGSRIDVRARVSSPWLVVEVEDRGMGIPQDDLPHIFDKFRQGGDALRDKPAGSGLGLAICREIVWNHGGEIHADSSPGRGSTFTFRLPLAAKHQQERLSGPGIETPREREEDREAPLVLVVSGSGATGAALARSLEQVGLRSSLAAGSEDALRRAASECPDLVLLDVLGAGVDTDHPGAHLRRSPVTRDIPLVLTALPEDADAHRSGADAILTRPIDPDGLVRTVHRLLGHRPPRVLVLEEDVRQRGFLRAQLQRSGMHALTTAREDEFLFLARTENPDLVVIGSGGHEEFLRALRSSSLLADRPVLYIAPSALRDCPLIDGASPDAVARAVAARLSRPSVARPGSSPTSTTTATGTTTEAPDSD